jgi:hypothetical protein
MNQDAEPKCATILHYMYNENPVGPSGEIANFGYTFVLL